MVEKILNNTTPYGKIRASHDGSLHSSTLSTTERRLINAHNLTTFDSGGYKNILPSMLTL